MPAIPINIADHVGRTPMVQLTRLASGAGAEVFAKLEMFNPGGSVKDRIGVAMIEAAEAEGRIEPGRTTIVEATSGNTGIALAFVCAAKGYDLILTLPQGMSREREGLLRLYGAQVHVTESMGGMNEAVAAAQAMARDGDVWLPDQFANPANPEAHRRTTGPGAVGGARRQDRLPRRRRRHRRHDHRRRQLPEGAQQGPEGDRGRARLLAGALRRPARPAQDPGHRRGLRPAGARPLAGRRDHRRRRRGRARDGAARGPPRGRAGRHLLRRRDVRRARDRPAARRPRASGSRSCCPTRASATSRRRSSPQSPSAPGRHEPARGRGPGRRSVGAADARDARPPGRRVRRCSPTTRSATPPGGRCTSTARPASSSTTRARCPPST